MGNNFDGGCEMTFRRLFCRHIWKDIKEEFLEKKKEQETYITYTYYNYYAVFKKCIKCDADKIKIKRYIVIQ